MGAWSEDRADGDELCVDAMQARIAALEAENAELRAKAVADDDEIGCLKLRIKRLLADGEGGGEN